MELYKELVKLDEETHQYLDNNGQKYMGFSSFSDNFLIKPFNSLGASYGVAKSSGTSVDVVMDKWAQQREAGVRIDKALEVYFKTKQIEEANNDIVDLVRSVADEYKDYHSIFNQKVVYNKEYLIAGSPDTFGLTSARGDGQFVMSDFKVFEKDDLHEHKGWLFEPMNHLSYTKQIKIIFQLSYYAFQLEKLLNKRCKQLFIHLINPTTQTHQRIVVPYMKNDVILLLNTHKEKIKELLTVGSPMNISELI
jgi:hypothetical protein